MNFTALPKQVFHYQRFRRIVVILLTVAVFLGVMVVPFENAPNSTIHTLFDGMWWATTTITTVGYGDRVPVTVPGRSIGILLQIIGGLLFGSVVGTFTVYLNRARDEYYWQRLFERIDRQSLDIDELRKQVDFMVKEQQERSKPTKES